MLLLVFLIVLASFGIGFAGAITTIPKRRKIDKTEFNSEHKEEPKKDKEVSGLYS